jgi:hypothetical protein
MEHIRTLAADGFTVDLWDTGRTDGYGKTILRYALADAGVLIFEGEDLHCSPMHATDSDASVGALLSFLSLQPGDTDAEYFDGYTAAQLAWRDSGRAEDLAMLAMELEEGVNADA